MQNDSPEWDELYDNTGTYPVVYKGPVTDNSTPAADVPEPRRPAGDAADTRQAATTAPEREIPSGPTTPSPTDNGAAATSTSTAPNPTSSQDKTSATTGPAGTTSTDYGISTTRPARRVDGGAPTRDPGTPSGRTPSGSGPTGRQKPTAVTPQRPQDTAIRIALFGPTSGGKSTFLFGLLLGTPEGDPNGSWKAVPPLNDPLARGLRQMIRQRHFPPATQATINETWLIEGTPPAAVQARRWWSRRTAEQPQPERFNLTIADARGGATLKLTDDALENLATADGLILLLDPTLMMPEDEYAPRPDDHDPTYNYLDEVLPRLARIQENKGLGTMLRQHLTVCLSKFDDKVVFERAVQAGLVEREYGRQPYVPSGDKARKLFDLLCHESPEANDRLLPRLFNQYFGDRLAFHVTSSIGFYMEPGQDFDASTSANVIQRNNQPEIRRLEPLNVWDAVLGLYNAIKRSRAV